MAVTAQARAPTRWFVVKSREVHLVSLRAICDTSGFGGRGGVGQRIDRGHYQLGTSQRPKQHEADCGHAVGCSNEWAPPMRA